MEEGIRWERLEWLEVNWCEDGTWDLFAAEADGGEAVRWSVSWDAFPGEVLAHLPECLELTSMVCGFYDMPAAEQGDFLTALAGMPALEVLAVNCSIASLEPLADCQRLQRLSLVRCDASALPAMDITSLMLRDSTGIAWERMMEQTSLEALGIFGSSIPDTLEPLCDHPTLRTLILETSDPDVDVGGWPVRLTDPEGEIPAELGIPYETEELREFLERGDALIRIQVNTFR